MSHAESSRLPDVSTRYTVAIFSVKATCRVGSDGSEWQNGGVGSYPIGNEYMEKRQCNFF